MKGAQEFAELFKTGQYGRLYITSGFHARGKTFHIHVLPEGEIAQHTPWTNENAVEAYGIVSGQPGWTETYGWLHKGKWVEDFQRLVEEKRREEEMATAERQSSQKKTKEDEQSRIGNLLKNY